MVKHLSHFRKNEGLAVSVSFFVIFIIYILGINVTGSVSGTKSVCGNGACEVGENLINCEQDCEAMCGNSVCESGEKLTCPMDCKYNSQETKAVKFQTSLLFVVLSAVFLVIALFPISKFGTRQKARKKSRHRQRR